MLLEDQRIKNTEDFLKLIAYRLSGRDDLKRTQYKIKIEANNQIIMEPLVYIFPNRYNRKEADRIDVVSYMLTMMVSDRGFVPGTYMYKCSSDNKRRKWIRVE